MAAGHVEVTGLTPLVRQLKGPMFKDLNRELRAYSKLIATDLVPVIADAVRQSQAPQAAAMAATVRVHSDRVPVVAVGKVNPRFARSKFRGGDTKRRRGALAHGVVYGPLGGKRSTPAAEDYYHIPRDSSGGPLGAALRGPALDRASELYLRYFLRSMQAHGFASDAGDTVHWEG